ncbi:MAG: hypothetical protein XD72_1760 [Methanothrix harundinacea]|uniref:Uncharacterized protein n=1 Tax=Methanothrix harundinacea TaxID=301375 RepID=A0A101FSW4_9EURY|nr:MAG: hypothetical protein XD72_1760 [Methanothrix harundinacea]KUK95988.1 MAG: hypothetical protein XE07_1424 [Methanothrix harundinacea]
MTAGEKLEWRAETEDHGAGDIILPGGERAHYCVAYSLFIALVYSDGNPNEDIRGMLEPWAKMEPNPAQHGEMVATVCRETQWICGDGNADERT